MSKNHKQKWILIRTFTLMLSVMTVPYFSSILHKQIFQSPGPVYFTADFERKPFYFDHEMVANGLTVA